MRQLRLDPTLLLATILGFSGCAADDTGDDSNDSANDSAGTTADTAMTTEAMTTEAMTTEAMTTEPATDDGQSSGELVLADIEVTVAYEGELTGTLNVVAITEFPPAGPPVATTSDPAPTFPWTGTLNDLEAGEYIIFATLDVGDNNPTIPGAEDPGSTPDVMVTVDSEGPFMVDVVLMDPR